MRRPVSARTTAWRQSVGSAALLAATVVAAVASPEVPANPAPPSANPTSTTVAIPGSAPGVLRASAVGPASTVRTDLTDPRKRDIAMRLVASAENSTLNWRTLYGYVEDIGDGRGYTAGIIGFCSGTGDLLRVVERYAKTAPNTRLARYLPALRRVNGTDSHAGLRGFPAAWRTAARGGALRAAQNAERDQTYFDPAVRRAKSDGLRALGQFIYYDAMVMHGPGDDPVSFGGIRRAAMRKARTPAQGGSEVRYLHAFLTARAAAMRTEEAHADTSRIDTAQRVFLRAGNLNLNPPLTWRVYGDRYHIAG